MSRREVKTSPDDRRPYRCGKEMYCYVDGVLSGGYTVHGKLIWSWFERHMPQSKMQTHLFKTQKAAKEWVTEQLRGET